MSEGACGGGALRAGFGGGAIVVELGRVEALCAEFKAGNDGGGILSSSSSLELSCSASVKVGIAPPFVVPLGSAFGVV
jgi:hypothetical protein